MARASLEELKLDYEDFLRQRELLKLEPQHPALVRFKKRKCQTLDDVKQWIDEERKRTRNAETNTNKHGKCKSEVHVGLSESPCLSLSSACLAANAALSLLNLACHLLNRQVERLAQDFENEGSFTEHLYRVRKNKMRQKA